MHLTCVFKTTMKMHSTVYKLKIKRVSTALQYKTSVNVFHSATAGKHIVDSVISILFLVYFEVFIDYFVYICVYSMCCFGVMNNEMN